MLKINCERRKWGIQDIVSRSYVFPGRPHHNVLLQGARRGDVTCARFCKPRGTAGLVFAKVIWLVTTDHSSLFQGSHTTRRRLDELSYIKDKMVGHSWLPNAMFARRLTSLRCCNRRPNQDSTHSRERAKNTCASSV